jgi:hypothetical protein
MPNCGFILGIWGELRQPPLHLQKHQPGHACTDAAGPVIAQQFHYCRRADANAQAAQQEAVSSLSNPGVLDIALSGS